MIDKIFRWALFCAGIITSIFAGYMFYIDNIAAGAAWLAMAVGFLCFATRIRTETVEEVYYDSEENNRDLHDMAVLISDIALMSVKNIGRTIPPDIKEIEELENKLNNFLNLMPVEKTERAEISEEFDRLKERSKRNASGRAILRSARL
ncbi:MAG: hypothetical protein IJM82_04020 [Synergistaceae bacterium]|nr:hypothetical protein [Synergistaceae bacterium]MBQ7068310.1 hypothetical protein [Synergistaceae bacterium]MBR0074936.1 hypothetical protein [Synergistaceae bacterium]MBR0232933.1 hypothetical protein [Synergistaceae bacterium]MBR0252317.1 hypothetical protein [Synergistaceae bacterium]